MKIIEKIKSVKLTKLKINVDKEKFANLQKSLKLEKFDKKTKITSLVIIGILVIAIAGRKSPQGNDWEAVLPDSKIFDDPNATQISPEEDKYTAFFFEVYDLIKNRYWNILSDEQLGTVVKLSIEKIRSTQIQEIPASKEQIRSLLKNTMTDMSEDQKKEFTVTLTDMTLANLEPFGRSRLYNSKKQKELSNVVKNINPNLNHYEILGIDKEANDQKIQESYKTKLAELSTKPQTPEVSEEKTKVEKAYEVLGDSGNKKVYDELGVNPTIENRLITPSIFYIHITKFSPTTVEELVRVMNKADAGTQLDTLIIDLRGNIGGAIDGLPYFLGPFIGKDQYAYQFYSRGKKEDYKTQVGWLPSLVRYKKVIVLTDNQVQSSGEVFAAVLKKYNVGILVGDKTKGWGTVESVFKLNNQLDPENEEYSVLLVHSLTLRDDGLTIEGKGVEPSINTSNANWDQELNRYFNFPEITNAVRNLLRE